MRTQWNLVCVLAILWSAGAGWADEAHDLLEQAITAQGGATALAKTKVSVGKSKGTIADLNNAPFSSTVSFSAPDRMKQDLQLNIQGNDLRILAIINGDKCSLSVNEQPQPENPLLSQSLKAATYQREVIRLVPLKEAAYQLQTLPETPVAGKTAVGLRVSKAGQKDISLYFDKQSHLLVRIDSRAVEPANGQEFDELTVVQEHMVQDGVTLPKKISVTRNGNPYVSVEMLETKFVDALPASEFGG